MTYRDIKSIGSGGFGEVWKCLGVDGIHYAKKRLLPTATDSQSVERFRREVRLLKALNHPRIISIVASRVDHPPYWFVMPLLDGNLEDRLTDVRASTDLRQQVIVQVMDAIEYAHSEGVLHRDLKPGNILFDHDGNVVVGDFGLGRQIDAATTRRTQTGMGMGTPFYSAPEQLQDAKYSDGRGDIYSIGCLIYELFASVAIAGRLDLDLLEPALRFVVGKATRGEPNKRYQSVAELRSDFELALGIKQAENAGTAAEEIIKEYMSGRRPSAEDVESLIGYLNGFGSSPEDLHEAVMAIPVGLYGLLVSGEEAAATPSARAFAEHCANAGWPFSYCDKLADRLAEMVEFFKDSETKAFLIGCVARLGLAHNRYYVLSKAGTLIERARGPAMSLPLREELRSIAPSRLRVLAAYLNLAKIDPDLRELMVPDED